MAIKKSDMFTAEQMTEPHLVGVICVKDICENQTVTTVTRWGIVSSDPDVIAISIDNYSLYAHSMIKSGAFTLSIPDVKMKNEILSWGNNSGWYRENSQNNATEFIKLNEQFTSIKDAAIIFCCRVKQFIPFGNNYLFLCEVNEIYVDERKTPAFSWNCKTVVSQINRPDCAKNDLGIKPKFY